MNNETKDAMIASIDAVEVINDFITDWWSVNELYGASAKAVSQLVQVAQKDPNFMTSELRDYINQHIMMIDLLKEVTSKKGGEL
jgi:hypothetical protein